MIAILSTSLVVWLRHIEIQTLPRELEKNAAVFGIHFLNDPFANSAQPTPTIVMQSDTPDPSYWRFAAGLSAQFKYDIAGYIDYQRLQGLQYVSFQNVTVGLRIQHAFH